MTDRSSDADVLAVRMFWQPLGLPGLFDVHTHFLPENIERRVWAQFGPEPTGTTTEEVLGQLVIAPDGCTGDAEGHVWAADAVGGRAVRIAPGGEVVDEVRAPEGLGVFACALGGDDGRTLLLCCAPDFLEHARRPVREAVLLTTTVAVPHAGRP